VIIQNFKAKPDTRMANAPEPSFDELLWTVAVARLIFGDTLSVQAPPNLQEPGYGRLIEAGIDDWGGVSPVTPDHVNPERPWPQPGASLAPVGGRAVRGDDLSDGDIVRLCEARGSDFAAVTQAADALRHEVVGDTSSYAVVRNINYTNICYFRCGFCAFSKGKLAANLRGAPYLVPVDEIVRRCEEAWERGGTEVCLQGGIHPAFTGDFYVDICRAIKEVLPDLHVHAFSALEVWQGAATLELPLRDYLARLQAAGLASLPGTAAEILDDVIRALICPDKVTTEQWL